MDFPFSLPPCQPWTQAPVPFPVLVDGLPPRTDSFFAPHPSLPWRRTASAPALPSLRDLLPEFNLNLVRQSEYDPAPAGQVANRSSHRSRKSSLEQDRPRPRSRTASGPPRRTPRFCDCCGGSASRNGPSGKNTLCSSCGLSYLRAMKPLRARSVSDQQRLEKDVAFLKTRRQYMEYRKVRDANFLPGSASEDPAASEPVHVHGKKSRPPPLVLPPHPDQEQQHLGQVSILPADDSLHQHFYQSSGFASSTMTFGLPQRSSSMSSWHRGARVTAGTETDIEYLASAPYSPSSSTTSFTYTSSRSDSGPPSSSSSMYGLERRTSFCTSASRDECDEERALSPFRLSQHGENTALPCSPSLPGDAAPNSRINSRKTSLAFLCE